METLLKPVINTANGISKVPKIENKILSTKDYKIFKKILGNRKIHFNHLNKLKESMKEHDLMIPIVVNENLEVIDGQHRLQARVELGLQVYYIIINWLSISDTQKANANNKNWNSSDFLNYFVEQNFYHYKIFKQFKERFQFNMQETIGLLSDQGTSIRDFNAGDFNVLDLPKSEAIAEKIYQIQPFYKGFKRRSFVFAMIKVLKNENFDFEEFLAKVSYQSSKLVDCTDIDAYLRVIEDIYNYKRNSESKVRFR